MVKKTITLAVQSLALYDVALSLLHFHKGVDIVSLDTHMHARYRTSDGAGRIREGAVTSCSASSSGWWPLWWP